MRTVVNTSRRSGAVNGKAKLEPAQLRRVRGSPHMAGRNPIIGAFYERLGASGYPAKVSITGRHT